MITLHPITDRDYAWLLGEESRADGLVQCEGGIAPPEVSAMLRGVTAQIATTTDKPTAWLIAEGDLVVGMTSFTRRDENGLYEIGYGVAPAHEGRGVMTQALAALLPILREDGHRRLDRRDQRGQSGAAARARKERLRSYAARATIRRTARSFSGRSTLMIKRAA